MDFDDERNRRVAYHEAGHAWMMVREGIGVRSVSLEPCGPRKGDNRGLTIPEKAMLAGSRDLSRRFAMAALAGSAAEHFLLGSWDGDGLHARACDTGRAKSYMVMAGDDWKPEALDHYITALSDMVMEEVSRPANWHDITILACELLSSGAMAGSRIEELLGGTCHRPGSGGTAETSCS